jgi:hypothetical protein
MFLRTAMVAGLLAMTTLTHAASDHDRWVDHLERYAVYVGGPDAATIVDAFSKAKSACVCTEEGSLSKRPGYITVGDGVDGLLSFCAIPLFDENGALESAVGCASYVPLVKK